jgi:hypothetical protein
LELEDHPWLPQVIRDGITDFLAYIVSRMRLFEDIGPLLGEALVRTNTQRVIDLCAGAGGPWLALKASTTHPALRDVHVLLTDCYPNVCALNETHNASGGHIDFMSESIDAQCVPGRLNGFRTLFSSFHHFAPDAARAIIRDAVDHGRGLAIFESTQRHPLMFAYMLFTPLIVLLTLPFHRGLRLSKLFWTYLIPAIPLAVMFDGIVSCLRTYTPDELHQLVDSVAGSERYHWVFGVQRLGPLPIGVTYMIGYPASDAEPQTIT